MAPRLREARFARPSHQLPPRSGEQVPLGDSGPMVPRAYSWIALNAELLLGDPERIVARRRSSAGANSSRPFRSRRATAAEPWQRRGLSRRRPGSGRDPRPAGSIKERLEALRCCRRLTPRGSSVSSRASSAPTLVRVEHDHERFFDFATPPSPSRRGEPARAAAPRYLIACGTRTRSSRLGVLLRLRELGAKSKLPRLSWRGHAFHAFVWPRAAVTTGNQ